MSGLRGREDIFLKNNLSEIERLATSVAEFGARNDLASEVIYDIRLVLEEIVSNIIHYAYEDNYERQIYIHLHLENEILTLEIKDDGKFFNLLEFNSTNIEKSPDERDTGGMGIYLVKKLMDKIEYKREDDKNILLLKKYVSH